MAHQGWRNAGPGEKAEAEAEHHIGAAVSADLRRPVGGKDGGLGEHWAAAQNGRDCLRMTVGIRPLAVTNVRVISRHFGTGCVAGEENRPCLLDGVKAKS